MISRLQAPYPAPRPGRSAVLGGLFMALFVVAFLLYFRPFGLRQEPYRSHPELIAYFGLLTLLACWLLELVLPWLFPRLLRDAYWRVWHQMLFYLLLLLLIATLNGLYINYVEELPFSWRNYRLIVVQTVALGILPVALVVLYRYNAKLATNLEQAMEMNGPSKPAASVPPPEDAREPDRFLAAEAYGNYVKIYYATPEGWEQEIERTTLQKLVEARTDQGVVRCHRSYAVAPGRVKKVTGNAQGLKLWVGNGQLEIPVSRTYLAAVREALA